MSLVESGHTTGQVSLRALFDEPLKPYVTEPVSLDRWIELTVRGGWPGSIDLDFQQARTVPGAYLQALVEDDMYGWTACRETVGKLRCCCVRWLERKYDSKQSIAKKRHPGGMKRSTSLRKRSVITSTYSIAYSCWKTNRRSTRICVPLSAWVSLQRDTMSIRRWRLPPWERHPTCCETICGRSDFCLKHWSNGICGLMRKHGEESFSTTGMRQVAKSMRWSNCLTGDGALSKSNWEGIRSSKPRKSWSL